MNHPGTLTIVPTPLGNLDDITTRALTALKKSNVIAAEDTRRTQKLLNHFGIAVPMLSFFEGNRAKRIPGILSRLKSGHNVCLVSSAGTPTISDPGADLVDAARDAGIQVIPLPGASSVTLILSAAGWRMDGFTFLGYLPRKRGKATRELQAATDFGKNFVIFESPHRIVKTLQLLDDIMPDATLFLGREMTKVYEEFLWGQPREIMEILKIAS